MNVYTIKGFKGRWPVGTSAIIVADTYNEAKEVLENTLRNIGLPQEIDLDDIREVSTSADKPYVLILNDGDY